VKADSKCMLLSDGMLSIAIMVFIIGRFCLVSQLS
jgi:hypothetical protein